MNKKFTKLMAALALLTFLAVPMGMWGQTTITFTSVSSVTAGNVTVLCEKSNGSSAPAWYDPNIRLYAKNTITITPASGYQITGLAYSFYKQGSKTYASASMTSSDGTYTDATSTSSSEEAVAVWSGTTTDPVVIELGDSGQRSFRQVVVTTSSSGGGSQAAVTTTTIDASGITNTDVYVGSAAGSLSATVTSGNNTISGATVTWSGNNNSVATINAGTGAVTLVGAGTVTFTATYAGVSGTYQGSSATYEMTVVDNTPYVQPTVIEITPNYTFWGKTAQFNGSDFSELSGSQDNASLNWTRGTGSMYANTTAMRFYKDNTLTFTAPTGYEIKSIVLTATDSYNDLSFSPDGWNNSTKTWSGAASTVTMSRPSNASSYINISKYTITIGLPKSVAMPTFSLAAGTYGGTQNVTISCETAGTTIYYTTDGTTPSASNGTQGISVTITENTTLKAIAIKDGEESDVATAVYTIVTPLSTMDAIFADATANTSAHSVYITFNNWVVSGVSGSNAYLTDGVKGCKIWTSGHGFTVGKVLSGTVQCKLQLYSGASEITELTSTTTGLSVSDGGTITPIVTTIEELGPVNLGAPIKLVDVTYSSSTSILTDGAGNTIKPYATLNSYSSYVADGKTYDFTGIFDYQNGKRILPRGSADIVLKADLDIDASMTPFSYIVGNGPSAAQNIDIICTDLGTNNLKATASSDYEVSLALEGPYYQYIEMNPTSGGVAETVYVRLKAGLSVGEHNGTVTFTAANLTTVEVALEGTVSNTATYDISLTQPQNEIATIAADKAIAEKNETVTLSYSILDDCYEFTSWTVWKDDLETEVAVTNNQFTMPDCEVLVEATFTKKTFVVSFSVNGIVYDALDITGIECGNSTTLWDADDLEDESITMPTGYTFTGWSTAAGSSETVSSFTPTENATLYAVMVPENAFTYVKVTRLQDITAGEYFIVNDGYVLPNADATNAGPVKTNDYKITTPLSDSYETLPVAGTAWTFTGTNEAMTIMNSTTNHYLYVAGTSNNNQVRVSTTSDHTWSFAVNGTGFSMKDNKNSRYCATYEAGEDWRSYNSATASNYGDYGILYLYKKSVPTAYTRIEEITSAENLPSIEPTYLITVQDGGVLTLTGPNNGDASNLIIEDGAQLITNSAVNATVQKEIAGFGSDNTVKTGWYTIASPVTSTITPADDMLQNTYDLYYYDETDTKWYNYKLGNAHSGFNLAPNTGYLYANSGKTTLSFAGEMRASNANVSIPLRYASSNQDLKGFNLVGNPFVCNITNTTSAMLGGDIFSAYYIADGTVNNDGKNLVAYTVADRPIKPGEGFFVQASAEGQSLAFNVRGGNEQNGYIRITAGNESFTDRAYIQFGDGNTLRKMTLSDNTAKVFVMQDNNEFAAAIIEVAQGEMPVNFKANENGQYTLTVNPENVEMGYLHLIDNMTGADIDLLATPSYSFEAKTTDYESRFRLVFAANNEDGVSTGSTTFDFFSNGSWIINNEGEATLQVIDLNGRILSSETINGSVSTSLNATTGIYMMRLINGDNVKTQKVVVR